MDRLAGGSRSTRALTHYDPGRDAAERYPEWVIRHRDLHGIPEVMDVRRRVILIDGGQSRGARRAGLAHAIAHLDLGHVVIGGHLGKRQEAEAEQLAARRLITVDAVADAVRWHGWDWAALAAEVEVDERLLRVWREHAHPAEMGRLRALLNGFTLGESA